MRRLIVDAATWLGTVAVAQTALAIFRGVENGQINAEIGCDGEENTTPEIRHVMSAVAMTISAFFATFGQADAAESSARLASYLATNEVPK